MSVDQFKWFPVNKLTSAELTDRQQGADQRGASAKWTQTAAEQELQKTFINTFSRFRSTVTLWHQDPLRRRRRRCKALNNYPFWSNIWHYFWHLNIRWKHLNNIIFGLLNLNSFEPKYSLYIPRLHHTVLLFHTAEKTVTHSFSHHGLILMKGMGAQVKKTVMRRKDFLPQMSDRAPIRGADRNDRKPWTHTEKR